ncbi:MAG: phosphoribosylformylglycinamidine synthase subunit PurL [Chloroflexi bacterium]|nr:phosphoribosylformylglycinamidine synthase subunit PurL [Chloroflexota bacterium]
MPVTQETLDEIALSRAEYEAIVDRLGREPNGLELGLFGALWSEHCGYKHSKPLLRTLPSNSPHLLVAPGAENAGVIDIGDGLAIAFKIESHNHPSAIEPHEGAATGVGGIVRDIFAMGARPIALLNSLRFGPPDTQRNRYLFNGVVGGISAYGNCIGIPNVGGEVVFDESYSENPLVNALCVGLIENGRIMSASPRNPGDILMLVGADTGRDGIHGASGLASRTFEDQAELRSAVQVGNPFLEKVLIEACLEAIELDTVVGLQDCGAAGLTSAAIECAERGNMGLHLDVAKVPRREEGMNAYEVMLSESQERMLLMVSPGGEAQVTEIFDKWDLWAVPVGEFVTGDTVDIYDGDALISSTSVRTLTDPPEYSFTAPKPAWLSELNSVEFSDLPLPDKTPSEVLLQLLGSANIASRRSVFQQYDHQVQTNTVVSPGGDAAVMRLRGTKSGIALSTDGNGRLTYLAPFAGGAIAVAEACRNMAAVGARPLAATDCLNFGNPDKPDIQYQLTEAVAGIKAACDAFDIPVVSGNVSLYNEGIGSAIYPTPVIGTLGKLEDVSVHATAGFKGDGDAVYLLGVDSLDAAESTLGGSEYLTQIHGLVEGEPTIDLELEVAVQNACIDAVEAGIIRSAHDCSDGGLAIAIAESCVIGGFGATIDAELSGRWDAALFGEQQSRIVVTVDTNHASQLEAIAAQHGAPAIRIGTTGGKTLTMSGLLDVLLTQLTSTWDNGLSIATSG